MNSACLKIAGQIECIGMFSTLRRLPVRTTGNTQHRRTHVRISILGHALVSDQVSDACMHAEVAFA